MTIAQQASVQPKINLNPITWWQWWTSPRATRPEEAFRERSIRLFLLIYAPIMIYSVLNSLSTGSTSSIPGVFEAIIGLLIVFYVASVYFLLKGYVGWAGLFVALNLTRSVIAHIINNGVADLNSLVINVLVMTIFMSLVLSARLVLLTSFGLSVLSFITAWVSVELGLSAPPESTWMALAAMLFMLSVIAGGPLSFLRLQLSKNLSQLEALVDTLEQRVEDRTQELTVALHQAKEADRLKSQFLASMSHELRTPLNAILNFNEMVGKGVVGPVNEMQEKLLGKSLASGRHLLNLINDVLDITKIQSGMLTLFVEDDCDLNEEVQSVVSIIEPLAGRKPDIQFIIDVDPNLPIITADKRRVRQVMLNLLSNAVKFIEHGSVTLSVKRKPEVVQFAVLDTGAGISSDAHELIFEPFKQTEAGIIHQGGTGLGLPISKQLVEAHGGRLWLDSTPGEGATFYFTLPIESTLQVTSLEDTE